MRYVVGTHKSQLTYSAFLEFLGLPAILVLSDFQTNPV